MTNATTFTAVIASIARAHHELAIQASKAVNISLTVRNWLIGYYLAEYELHGSDRASYGESLFANVAEALTQKGVASCGKRQLYAYLGFYQLYLQIVRSLPAQFYTAYVNWYRQHMMTPGDNPPVGLLLCTDKNHALAEYALAGMDNQLFISKYQLELPKKEEMQRFLVERLKQVEQGGAG